MKQLWRTQPALVVGAINALIALAVGFGAPISTTQTGLILAAVNGVMGVVTWTQVSPAEQYDAKHDKET